MNSQEYAALGMIEVKEPELVKFEKPGASVEGILRAIDTIQVADPKNPRGAKKSCNRYTVEVEPGTEVVFLGSVDIDRQIKLGFVDHVLIVKYEGEDPAIVRNGNAMRRYKVAYSKDPVTVAA